MIIRKIIFLKNKQAFSLIELSIVILIIGILVAGVTQSSRLIKELKNQTLRQLVNNSPVNSIKDLVLWLETTQAESLVEAEAQDGLTINQWFDINKFTISKSIAISYNTKPTYRASGINNLPAIYFGGGGWFDVGFSATRNNTKTIFLVFMTQNNNQRNYLFDNATSPQFCFIVESNSSSVGHMHAGVSNLQGNFQIKKPYIVTLIYNGANSFFRNNGVQNTAGNVGNNPFLNSIRIGNYYQPIDVNEGFIGHIGEFIIFDRVLKADEYLDVEKYLSKKWGIKF
jgi:prepilin-type N-terminal cleavage/methylation domain-containing protein